MPHSKVGICNIALASVGADHIRAIDENNKRARMCNAFYDLSRDLLLSKFDWPFARKYVELNLISPQPDVPFGEYVYILPADCKTPRTIGKLGTSEPWRIMGTTLVCKQAEDVFLFYTAVSSSAVLYSDTFADLLALHIAVRLAPALTQDKRLVASLQEQYRIAQAEAWESDANIGDNYIEPDGNPDNDTFVNPDGPYEVPWWEQ